MDDERRAVAAQKIAERLDERDGERSGAPALRFPWPVQPRRQKAAADSDERQPRHREIGGAPAGEIGDVERAGPGAEHRQAIAELIRRRHHALALDRRGVDAPAVDGDVLARGGEGGQEREEDAPAEAFGRRAECEPGEPRGDARLRDQHPAAPAPEPGADQRRIIFVDDRRPGKLEGERERRIAHEPDRRAADPRLPQPDRLGREDQKERQPRGEAEREHQREARISQDFTERGRFAGRCHGSYADGLLDPARSDQGLGADDG